MMNKRVECVEHCEQKRSIPAVKVQEGSRSGQGIEMSFLNVEVFQRLVIAAWYTGLQGVLPGQSQIE